MIPNLFRSFLFIFLQLSFSQSLFAVKKTTVVKAAETPKFYIPDQVKVGSVVYIPVPTDTKEGHRYGATFYRLVKVEANKKDPNKAKYHFISFDKDGVTNQQREIVIRKDQGQLIVPQNLSGTIPFIPGVPLAYKDSNPQKVAGKAVAFFGDNLIIMAKNSFKGKMPDANNFSEWYEKNIQNRHLEIVSKEIVLPLYPQQLPLSKMQNEKDLTLNVPGWDEPVRITWMGHNEVQGPVIIVEKNGTQVALTITQMQQLTEQGRKDRDNFFVGQSYISSMGPIKITRQIGNFFEVEANRKKGKKSSPYWIHVDSLVLANPEEIDINGEIKRPGDTVRTKKGEMKIVQIFNDGRVSLKPIANEKDHKKRPTKFVSLVNQGLHSTHNNFVHGKFCGNFEEI